MKNIKPLMDQLIGLGFPKELEPAIQFHSALSNSKFEIRFREDRGNNIFLTKLDLQPELNGPGYILSYEVALYKLTNPPSDISEAVNFPELVSQMQAIDWDELGTLRFNANSLEVNLPSWVEANKVIGELEKISSDPRGVKISDQLRLQFWINTPFKKLISKGILEKSISQKFYFFDGDQSITLNEVYKFLFHKLRDKEKVAEKIRLSKHGKGSKKKRS